MAVQIASQSRSNTETSRVYVGMLIVTIVAMAIGITVLALEGMEYDWQQKPAPTQKVELPKETPVAAAPAGGALAPVAAPARVAVAVPTPDTLPVSEVSSAGKPLPLILQPTLLPPVVAVETPKPVVIKPTDSRPAAAPTGPIPSPLVIPRD